MPLRKMVDIVIATGNRHKFRELARLLDAPGIRWHSLEAFPRILPVRETGKTFDANAVKKAKAVARATALLALADDSGIEVAALGGLPGIYSARFAGSHGDDAANNRKLLRILEGVPSRSRKARYRCSLALADGKKVLLLTSGSWMGYLATVPHGRGGFGYDPIVIIPKYGKTVAQLAPAVKRRESHRAAAAKKMRPLLRKLIKKILEQASR